MEWFNFLLCVYCSFCTYLCVLPFLLLRNLFFIAKKSATLVYALTQRSESVHKHSSISRWRAEATPPASSMIQTAIIPSHVMAVISLYLVLVPKLQPRINMKYKWLSARGAPIGMELESSREVYIMHGFSECSRYHRSFFFDDSDLRETRSVGVI